MSAIRLHPAQRSLTLVLIACALAAGVAAFVLLAASGPSPGPPAPPSVHPALRGVPEPRGVLAHVGPGSVSVGLRSGAYRATLRLWPNRPTRPYLLSLRLMRHGRPVEGARVSFATTMLTMDMGTQLMYRLSAQGDGRYARVEPPVGMHGRWALRLTVTPPHARRFTLTVVDRLSR